MEQWIKKTDNYLAHYGVLGMKWGVRRYQNEDGSLTEAGKRIRELNNVVGIGADKLRAQGKRLSSIQDDPYRRDRIERDGLDWDEDATVSFKSIHNTLSKFIDAIEGVSTSMDSERTIYDNGDDDVAIADYLGRGTIAISNVLASIGDAKVDGSRMTELVENAARIFDDLWDETEPYN